MKALLYLSFVLLSFSLCAQESLKTADDYFKKNDFEKTLQILQILLNNPDQLKGDERPFAYVLRAKTYINLLDQAVKTEDKKELEKYKDAYFLAFQDLQEAQKLPMGELAKKETDAVANYLYHSLRMVGANFLSNIYLDAEMTPNARKIALDEAQKYFMATISLKADDYLAYDFYGQVMMLKKADDLALEYFSNSKKYFRQTDKDIPDFGHFRVYGNIAIIQMKQKNSLKALETIEEGKKGLDTHFQLTKPQVDELIDAYKMMKSDLEGIEMDIYLNSPDLLDQALSKFKSQCQEQPKNLTLRLAYAQLLEQKNNYSEAVKQYEAALEIDSTQNLIWFNLGALHLNEGLEMAEKLDPKNPDPVQKAAMQDLLKKSINPLKKALELDENDFECINALMKVYSRLEMKEEYLYYRNLKTEKLKGG